MAYSSSFLQDNSNLVQQPAHQEAVYRYLPDIKEET